MPAIISFLGYNPLPPASTWAERLINGRRAMGLSLQAYAQRIGADQSTLRHWERGEREPTAKLAVRARTFLSTAESLPPAMTA